MSQSPSHRRSTCCLCQSTDLQCLSKITHLPYKSPNVGATTSSELDLSLNGGLVPLDLYLCGSCFHMQLADIINPEVQYTNYLYQTSVSLGLASHFQESVLQILSWLDRSPRDLSILEFGSNDGTFLSHFQQQGSRVLGMEPAIQVSADARARGIPTITNFFNAQTASEALDFGYYDIVAANYVFANIEALDDVIEGVKEVLKEDGLFVFETQYGVDVVERFLLDTIYHEHISYFNVLPLTRFFLQHGMKVVDVERIQTKGGSIRVYVQFEHQSTKQSKTVSDLIEKEKFAGFQSSKRLELFAKQIEENKDAVASRLLNAKSVAGYGASVGTMTLLHLYSLTDTIKYICDDNPLQDSLRGPSYDIPVVSSDRLYEESADAVVLFAWRYADNILPKHKRYMEDAGRFIVPLPYVREVIK
ncbi:MAG: methyltransferase domain-containing protein [Rhodospirillaceae bacterium]